LELFPVKRKSLVIRYPYVTLKFDMRKKLTEVAVSKLVPIPDKRLEIFDTLTPGLCLRITEKGKKSWTVVYRVAGQGEGGLRGRLRRMTLGSYPLIDLKEARDKARSAVDMADRGLDPADKRSEEIRENIRQAFEANCEKFIELHSKAHTVNWRDTECLFKRYIIPKWKGKLISSIDRATAHDLLDEISIQHGKGIAREVRKHLTKFFNWAVDRGILTASPVAGMRRPELGYVARERVLEKDELKAIWFAADAMGYPFGHMIKLLILTAQRRAEIANLSRNWLLADMEAFEVPASMYKTNRPQVVPLSPIAQKIVSSLPLWNRGEYMLTTTGGLRPISGFSKAKKRVDRISKVESWTFHDIRRSVATHMARLSIPQEHIERVLGHTIEGVAGTYNRYSYLNEKRIALNTWGEEWN
jgi:integrase